MRPILVRTLLGVAALLAGLSLFLPAVAAEVSDDDFKALVDQDVKAMTKATAAVEKAGKNKVVEKNAASGIKSSAFMLACIANDRITGKNAASDGKSAAVRDIAIKIYQAADKKDFKEVDTLVKGLANAKAAADAKKIDVTQVLNEYLKSLGAGNQLVQKDVMDNFKTIDKYGTNVEADIKANGKKATAKPADVNLIALRVLTMSELNKTITKAENAADKKEWDGYNEKMIKAAEELQATTTKKTTPAELAKAFTLLDSSCTACHDKFK